MRLNALLMCREPQSLRVLAAAMDALEIEQEVCVSAPQALELLAQRFYSALMVDFDLPTAAQLVRLARVAPAQRRPVVFAVIGACTDVGGAYQSGVNFALYKPVLTSQVLRSLRAGRGFMQPDRRRSPRREALGCGDAWSANSFWIILGLVFPMVMIWIDSVRPMRLRLPVRTAPGRADDLLPGARRRP